MKKIIALFLVLLVFSSCLNNDETNFDYKLLPVDEFTVPTSFTFGQIDTIKIKYSLKNECYSFNNIYYEYKDTARIVAVRALVQLDKNCTKDSVHQEFKFVVKASQRKDYLFKFWKGTDNKNKDIFEEVIVPVN